MVSSAKRNPSARTHRRLTTRLRLRLRSGLSAGKGRGLGRMEGSMVVEGRLGSREWGWNRCPVGFMGRLRGGGVRCGDCSIDDGLALGGDGSFGWGVGGHGLCTRYEWDALAYEERDMAFGVDVGLVTRLRRKVAGQVLIALGPHGPQSFCTTHALTHEPSSSTLHLHHDTCRFYFRS